MIAPTRMAGHQGRDGHDRCGDADGTPLHGTLPHRERFDGVQDGVDPDDHLADFVLVMRECKFPRQTRAIPPWWYMPPTRPVPGGRRRAARGPLPGGLGNLDPHPLGPTYWVDQPPGGGQGGDPNPQDPKNVGHPSITPESPLTVPAHPTAGTRWAAT